MVCIFIFPESSNGHDPEQSTQTSPEASNHPGAMEQQSGQEELYGTANNRSHNQSRVETRYLSLSSGESLQSQHEPLMAKTYHDDFKVSFVWCLTFFSKIYSRN